MDQNATMAVDKAVFIERAGPTPERVERVVTAQERASVPITLREVTTRPVGRYCLLAQVNAFVEPMVLVVSLLMVALLLEGEIRSSHLLLAVAVFFLAFPGYLHLAKTISGIALHIVGSWFVLSGLLLLFGCVAGTISYFDRKFLTTWWCVAPLSQFAAQLLLRIVKPSIERLQGAPKRAVVAGVNEQGIELARRLGTDLYSRLHMVGFFDDRVEAGDKSQSGYPIIGSLQELPHFAKNNNIDVIYISLPMHSQPRLRAMLDGLRDTTSSIYFVPDQVITDLIPGRVDSVQGLPVFGVCETPFIGLDGVIKRVSDIAFSLVVLAFLAPLLLLIALGVKMSSPGPVIFRQRRYGLDGKCILVYKFRTMSVTEDGDFIQQASKKDPRVTRFGAFLRKTSLDELPQFINVLQGDMSVVGPRPHAVAHNEMYRKLIKGYMLRHKVRPGITGWAQVNGLRGETETLEKMKDRIDYDLDYLRHWSLRLDSYIIAKTIAVTLKDPRQTAY